MADSAFRSTHPSWATNPSLTTDASEPSHALTPSSNAKTLVRRLVWKMAIATFILMAIGSATRVMNAGLACPDWPLCYGTLYPAQQMNLQVFLEWFHRLDAALIGVMAIALMVLSWVNRRVLPGWMPLASVFAFFLIGFQGILGGLTVTEMLRFDIVTAHLGTALLFFMTLLVIGILLLPSASLENPEVEARVEEGAIARESVSESSTASLRTASLRTASLRTASFLAPTSGVSLKRIHWVALGATVLIYAQSLTGALVGSQWALHQCLTLASLCRVMNSHLVGVVPASLAALSVVILAWRNPRLSYPLRQLAWTVGGLLTIQILLGLATFKLHLQVELLTVLHQSVGAALLGTLLSIAVIGFRLQHLTHATAPLDP